MSIANYFSAVNLYFSSYVSAPYTDVFHIVVFLMSCAWSFNHKFTDVPF